MPAYYFDSDYCESTTLRDGQPIRLRLVRSDDKEMFRRGLDKLSPESRVRRFFVMKERLTNEELRYFTEIDQIDHVAIGAERACPAGVGDGADGSDGAGAFEGLGVARFIRCPDHADTAEAAVAVIDEMQGKGLGSLLFQRLVAAARARGISRLRCEVLSSNQAMRDFLSGAMPSAFKIAQSGPVLTIEMELPEIEPAHPHVEPPRQSDIYRLFTQVAKGAIDLPRALSRFFLGEKS